MVKPDTFNFHKILLFFQTNIVSFAMYEVQYQFLMFLNITPETGNKHQFLDVGLINE